MEHLVVNFMGIEHFVVASFVFFLEKWDLQPFFFWTFLEYLMWLELVFGTDFWNTNDDLVV
jgi:hypothetical protein